MSRKRKMRRAVGDVVSIPLGEDRVAFGLVLEEPLLAFFDFSCKVDAVPPLQDIVSKPIIFRIWVMNHALTDGLWSVIGRAIIPKDLLEPPWFFKQDPISGKVTLTKTGAEDVPALPNQYDCLERAAVWEPRHVVDRLRDHFASRPNKWVESMRPQLKRQT